MLLINSSQFPTIFLDWKEKADRLLLMGNCREGVWVELTNEASAQMAWSQGAANK